MLSFPRRLAHRPWRLLAAFGAISLLAVIAAGALADPAADDAPEQDVRQFLDRYFRSWSNQDLMRYGQCFMPQAAIQLVGPAGGLVTMPLAPFLKSQQQSQREASFPMTETPESIEVRFDAKLAHALVYWKLVDGKRIEYGYDHFTLMRSDDKWRIAHLIFYADKPPAESPK